MRKKTIRNIVYLLLFLTVVSVFSIPSYAQDKAQIIYFGLDSCSECIKTNKILDDIQKNYNEKINILKYDIGNKENESLFLSYVDYLNIETQVPLVILGDKYYNNLKDIQNNLQNDLDNMGNEIENNVNINLQGMTIEEEKTFRKDYIGNLSILAIMVAGLLDGVNPCALAMLIFFLTYIMTAKNSNKNILGIGIVYSIATFITYFTIGMGLIKFVHQLPNLSLVLKIIYTATILMCSVLLIITFKDYINVKRGNYKDVKTQLTKGMKHRIHDQIRKRTNIKTIYTSAFLIGIIVSILEFMCTGQVYLPTISYLITLGEHKTTMIIYLTLYNIMFIVPILILTFSIYLGKELTDSSQLLVSKLKEIKLITSMFYLVVIIYMIKQLINII